MLLKPHHDRRRDSRIAEKKDTSPRSGSVVFTMRSRVTVEVHVMKGRSSQMANGQQKGKSGETKQTVKAKRLSTHPNQLRDFECTAATPFYVDIREDGKLSPREKLFAMVQDELFRRTLKPATAF